MLTNRACTVVTSIEAAVTDNMLAWIEHVGCADAAAEQARLPIGLKKMHQDLGPPQVECVGRYVVGEVPKQRSVGYASSDVCSEGLDGTVAEIS